MNEIKLEPTIDSIVRQKLLKFCKEIGGDSGRCELEEKDSGRIKKFWFVKNNSNKILLFNA